MKTEYINLTVRVKITYDEGHKPEAIERAERCVIGSSIYGGKASAEPIKVVK